MARIEWVKHRLNNWALWKEKDSRGGLGWATQSVLLAERVDQSREINLYGTIDEVDAAKTDQAIESLKPDRTKLYETLYWIYIEDTGVKGAAMRASCSVAAIHDRLDRADHALSRWFGERAEAQKKSSST